MPDPRWIVAKQDGRPYFEVDGERTALVGYVRDSKGVSAEDALVALIRDRILLRRVLSEYVAGNRIVDGYWYSPDETGEPHNINDPATPDEVALIESLRDEDRQ